MKTDDIAKEAEIDLTLLAVQRVQVWFPLDEQGLPGPAGWFTTDEGAAHLKPSIWTVGRPVPGSDGAGFTILGIFANTDEVRVYATPDQQGKLPRRYTLSKTSPLIGMEQMSAEVVVAEVREELEILRGEDDDEIDVIETIVETLREKFPEASAFVKAEFMEEGETETNGATAPTQPAPAVEGPRF